MPIGNSLQHRIESIRIIDEQDSSSFEESHSASSSSIGDYEGEEHDGQSNNDDRLVLRVKSYPRKAMNSNGSFSQVE